MPEEDPQQDVQMDSIDEDNAQGYTLPPHIAARFQRKTSARRRSSAHSSRRSSLSSLHSHQSSLSCHGGPRSTHVAQHLRRASIIESRKARLADRAAHAEQVRLRAAIAKAQPRVSYSEERAQAAQAAREKLLADITARCEEEVKRAKKVAEETREKKAAEHARLQHEMAEKFAAAARRRSIYQLNARRPRTTSLSAVEERKIAPAALRRLSETSAAKVIQRAWKVHQRHKAVAHFLDLQLNVARMQQLSFEDATQLISEARVLSTTATLLKVLGLMDAGAEDLGERGSTRVFLSAYMLVTHSLQTLSHGGQEPQEQEVVRRSKALLDDFEKLLRTHSQPQTPAKGTDTGNLGFLFNEYTCSFHAWKTQDLGVIVDVMIGSFVNLDLILKATKDDKDGRVAEDYFNAIRQEQVKLLARLKKLAGPEEALSRVKVAVRKARKEKAKAHRRPSNENVPRTSTDVTRSGLQTDHAARLPTPPATPQSTNESPVSDSFVSRLGQTLTLLPSNREIAHEMLINGSYEVQQQPWTESRRHFVEAIRSSMELSMEANSDATLTDWTRAMAILIREKLLNLVTPRHPIYDRLDDFLETRLIERQCRNGAFSYPKFFSGIASLIAQICSPGRDEMVRSFADNEASDVVDRLFALINLIDLMTLDHVNFQFRLAAPQVFEHGREHEQKRFESDLQSGVHDLSNTRSWWRSARSSLVNTQNPSTQLPGQIVYARALTDLIFSNTHLQPVSMPETLTLDLSRIYALRARAFHLVATSSILLTTKIRLRRNRESLWSRDADRLLSLDLLSQSREQLSTRVVSLIESSHNMPDTTREGLIDFVHRALPPAIAAAQNARIITQDRQHAIQSNTPWSRTSSVLDHTDTFSEQVSAYHLKSLREHIFARLGATSTADKVRTTTSAAEVLARAGMPEFVAEVSGMVDTLERIRRVDLAGHAVWLDQIAEEVA